MIVAGTAAIVSSASGAEASPAVEARGMHKHYGAVAALQGANLAVRHGEVMGLVGDNGAGKSTLIKIISGNVSPTAGELWLRGKLVHFSRPADALDDGIETVYQDLSLVEPMTALENIFLGRELLRGSTVGRALRLLSRREMAARAADILADLGAKIPSLDAMVQDLSGGQRQSVAIARALLWGRDIVILDEPTAALGVQESEHAIETIQRLQERGTTVVVVSHNLRQLFQVATRITVMRLGRTVGVRDVNETDVDEVVSLITGATRGEL